MKIYRFRNCLLNTLERSVLKDGKRLDLTPKTFDVLQMLVERPGDIVTKDELLGRVWHGSFVEEGNLPVHIAKLRRQLDGDGSHRFIETVHGGGYRFTAKVEIVDDTDWQRQFAGFNRRKTDRVPQQPALDSIAVLPLRNETNDVENDYLADGLTTSLINGLSRTTGLRVMARDTVFRYKNKDADAKEVGDTLGVSTVLTGRIRLAKNDLFVGVELVKVADGSQLWGEQFDLPFSDLVKVKETIASAITERLQPRPVSVSPLPHNNPVTQNAESYRLYLKGKYFQETHTEENLHKAIGLFQESVFRDSENIHAHVGMIDCLLMLYAHDYIAYDDAIAEVNPVLSTLRTLNQNVDVLQVAYGRLKTSLEWNFNQAERHFQTALKFGPRLLAANLQYSHFLTMSKRFTEALQLLQTVLVIDPLSLNTYKSVGRVFYHMGQYERSLTFLFDALEMKPSDYEALILSGAVLVQMGDYAGALDYLQRSLDTQHNVDAIALMGYAYALGGKDDKAIEVIGQLEVDANEGCRNFVKMAGVYAALGESERAYEFLGIAIQHHESDVIGLNVDPRWNRIRTEPRFRELIRSLGFP